MLLRVVPTHSPYLFPLGRIGQLFSRRLLHWPATPNPTPYQIFGLDPTQHVLDKKRLQTVYCELVKMYHPDMSSTGNADRFKKVVEAHNILKDDAKRRSYDIAQHMYGNSGTSGTTSGDPQYRPQQDHAFEDDINVNYWSNRNQRNFDQGLYESRIWVLKLIVVLGTVFAVLNFMLLQKASDIRAERVNAETERVAAHLAEARGLIGLPVGNSPSDRIERFLKHRQNLLDKFDNEFSYDKLRKGAARRGTSQYGDSGYFNSDADIAQAKAETSDSSPPSSASDQEATVTHSSGKGQRQSKQNTGPVAEYFGRD